MTFRLASLVLALCSCATLSLPRANERAVPNPPLAPQTWVTPSGVTVLIDHTTDSRTVSLVTLVKGGGATDPAGQEGLAHLVAHASLRSLGAQGVPYVSAFEQAGATVADVRTTFDATVFELSGPPNSLMTWLPLELTRLSDPLRGVDEATFSSVRELVRNELRERREMVEGADLGWLQEAVFPAGHPYRHPALGTHESLAGLTLEQARAYAKSAYAPGQLVLAISGHVDPAVLGALGLRQVDVAHAPALATQPPEPPAGVMAQREAGVAAPTLYVVWSLPGAYSNSAEIVRQLPGYASRALANASNDEDFANISARTIPGARASLLVVTVELIDGTNPERTYQRVLNHLLDLARPLQLNAEAQRVYEAGINNYNHALARVYELEAPQTRARLEAFDLAFAGVKESVRWRLGQTLGKPDQRELERLAFVRQWVTRDRARAVLVRPLTATRSMAPPAVAARVTPAVPDPAPGVIKTFESSAALQPLVETLENGLTVVVVARPGWPVASAWLTNSSGAATGPLGAAVMTERWGSPRLLTYGSPWNYGLETERGFEQDVQWLASTGRAQNLPNLLAQFSTQLQSLHLDSQLQVQLSRYTYPWLRHGDALPERVATRAAQAALLPGSALGVLPVTGDLEKLDLGEVSGWVNGVSPKGAVLAIVGDVEPKAALEAARTWLGGWSGRPVVDLPEAPLPQPGAPLVTRRPGATQGHLTWSCRVPAKTTRQRLAAEVLAERLDEVANDLLREREGVTADGETTATLMRGGTGVVDVSAFIDADRFAAAASELEHAFQSMDAAQGLERARLGAARRLTEVQSSASSLSKFISTRMARGASLNEVTDPVGQLEQVTVEDVGAALQQCRATVVESWVGDFGSP